MSTLQFLSQNIWIYKSIKHIHTFFKIIKWISMYLPTSLRNVSWPVSLTHQVYVPIFKQITHTPEYFVLIILLLFFVLITYMYIPKWDSWMASLTQWAWVWASSGRLWRTVKPGMLQSMGSQRVGHDWATEQQQKYP